MNIGIINEAEHIKTVAVIVAHPDDETLWAGGMLLSYTSWDVFILSLCRGSDPDRAPKFLRALAHFNADGAMGDLDDATAQQALTEGEVEDTILTLLPAKAYDLIITHNPNGEYTRHLRHEEVSQAVINLWYVGKIKTKELWTFAYEDGGKKYLPQPRLNATAYFKLPRKTWESKNWIINTIYGFSTDSWEAQTTPKAEAFWKFNRPERAKDWLIQGGREK
ncbi:hypothetical protein GCM10023231_40990 [Olivibacter ginsenosidimutans]|uniref:PIG-L family deacetylase n=1 Tax=Olivibacter ginsenosidimutans TaxID=1176537 RepID=A0ABP9CED2_9SPHI